jgi:diguanylate cyclase (GGDEF)-like protein
VLQAEEQIDQLVRAKTAEARDQRNRVRWIAFTAASYALDTAFLGLFAFAGTIDAAVALGYLAAAVLICGGTLAATLKGWNLRLRDPSMTEPLIIVAIALQLSVVAAAPQIGFPFLANLFTVFAFGMTWLSVRDSFVVWTLGTMGTATVFYAVGDRLGLPTGSAFELALVWLYFSLILGRCLLLSVNANEMRERLAEGRRRLAASLEQVQQLASRDELTRSLNRRSLMAALEREHSRAERSGEGFAIAMIDLDHFKQVNDNHGHAAGDAVLSEFAATVHDAMRITDVFGRYGGEEFLLILVGSAPEAAREALERIRAAVQARDWNAVAPGLRVTMSAGIARFRKGETSEQILHRADIALYEAKRGGRNRIEVNPE